MGLFGSSKIDGKELQECLAYFEAENQVLAFQVKEADLFNNAMVEYGNSIMETPAAAWYMKKATKRLSQAATEILKRHEKIKNVPVEASSMHSAWHKAFLANAAWASAMVKAIESNIFALLAMAEGMNPQIEYAQQLAEEYHKAYRNAEAEYEKLLKRLKIGEEDKAKIATRATTIDATDDWKPKIADKELSHPPARPHSRIKQYLGSGRIGNSDAFVFHHPDCRHARQINNEKAVWFESPDYAINDGYKPCKICRPQLPYRVLNIGRQAYLTDGRSKIVESQEKRLEDDL